MPPKKKAKPPLDNYEELNERINQFSPDQRFKLMRHADMGGKGRYVYVASIVGFDPDVIQRTYGGGLYNVRPVDERDQFLPGQFNFPIAGAEKPIDKILPGDDPQDVVINDQGIDLSSLGNLGNETQLIRYLIDQNKGLSDKFDSLQTSKGSGSGLNVDEINNMLDTIMQKQIMYSAMAPMINSLKGNTGQGEKFTEIFTTVAEIIKQGVKLGQGQPSGEETGGIVGMIEKYLPLIMQLASKPKAAPLSTDVPAPAVSVPTNPGVSIPAPGEIQSEESMLPARVIKAIDNMLECFCSEAELSVEEIVSDYIEPVLSHKDIDTLGGNLTYEGIVQVLSEQGDFKGKLIARENVERVKEIITVLRRNANAADGDTPKD